MSEKLQCCDLGKLSYREGLELQQAMVQARAAGATGDWLLFQEHAPVLTVGRNPSDGNQIVDDATLAKLGIERFEVSRGGDITWHGPGQLVGYPILLLDRLGRDLHRYLRALESALIDVLAEYGIPAGVSPGRTGVWAGEEKIASIGVAVRRWVSYHGFALNVSPDLRGFDLIHPCGLHGVRMTSMAKLLGEPPVFDAARERTAERMAAQLGFEGTRWAAPSEVLRVVEPAVGRGAA
jgi:lipoate-protein ligase B